MATEPALAMTPLEYATRADKEMAFGNHRAAAGLLWQSIRATFIGLAEERGLPYADDLIVLAKTLEADGSVRKRYYSSNLGAGKLLRDHAELDALDPCMAKAAYSDIRQFVVEQHGEF